MRARKKFIEGQQVSVWWWVLAIFLGIIGGLIAWGCTKEKIGSKARNFIWVGLICTVLWWMLASLLSYLAG